AKGYERRLRKQTTAFVVLWGFGLERLGYGNSIVFLRLCFQDQLFISLRLSTMRVRQFQLKVHDNN
ncbi:MAG: hypothetical protein J7578_21560, partial [Chitinophagaceae bacterium]|nr:hypothetical protein [Chitinophagaceae bacterium]